MALRDFIRAQQSNRIRAEVGGMGNRELVVDQGKPILDLDVGIASRSIRSPGLRRMIERSVDDP